MQFSLRSLLFAVTGIACYVAICFARPPIISVCGLALLSAALIPTIVGGIVYSRDAWRAFWIGCAVAAVPLAFQLYWAVAIGGYIMEEYGSMVRSDDDAATIRGFLAIQHCVIVLSGFVVIAVRRTCRRNRQAYVVADALSDAALSKRPDEPSSPSHAVDLP